jgi:hypothetical protein
VSLDSVGGRRRHLDDNKASIEFDQILSIEDPSSKKCIPI